MIRATIAVVLLAVFLLFTAWSSRVQWNGRHRAPGETIVRPMDLNDTWLRPRRLTR